MNVGPSSVAENAMLNRAFLEHQHQQQLFAGSGHHLSSFPPLHQLGTVGHTVLTVQSSRGGMQLESMYPWGFQVNLCPPWVQLGQHRWWERSGHPFPLMYSSRIVPRGIPRPIPFVYCQSHLLESPSLPPKNPPALSTGHMMLHDVMR